MVSPDDETLDKHVQSNQFLMEQDHPAFEMSPIEKPVVNQSKEEELSGSGKLREIAPGGPTWEEPVEVIHPGAPPLLFENNEDIVFSKQKHKKKAKKKGTY